MKRRCTILRFFTFWLAAITLLFSCDTSDNVEDPDLHYFVKLYGADGDQHGVDMLALSDGSLLLLGNSSESNVESSIYMARVSADGDVIWEKTFEDGYAIAKDLEPTIDGNFIVLADYIPLDADSFDVQLLKISPDGELLASRAVGTDAHDYGSSVTPISDGGFIVSGTSELTRTWINPNDPDPDLGDVLSYRFDANFNLLSANDWSPVVHGWGSNLDVAVNIRETPSGFYTFGYTNSSFGGVNDIERFGFFYFERGTTGTLGKANFTENTVGINDTRIEFVQAVRPELGGGILAIGTSVNSIGVSEVFMTKMRSSLTFEGIPQDALFYKNIDLGRNIRGVSATSSVFGEYGFLILGNEVRSANFGNFWISKIDQSGTIIWSATFGSEGEEDLAASVVELPDGKIVILGTIGMADNQYKMALIKLNSQGQLLK